MPFVLIGLNPPLRARTFVLDARPWLIGRDPQCDIVIPDRFVSRQHCWLEPDGDGGWIVRDLGSANGTWHNEIRVEPEAPLAHGDTLRIARTYFLVFDPHKQPTVPTIPWPNMRFDPVRGRVLLDDAPLIPPLTPMQQHALHLLWEQRGIPVPAERLLRQLWPQRSPKETRQHLQRLVEQLRERLHDQYELLIQHDEKQNAYVLTPTPEEAIQVLLPNKEF